MMFTCNAASKKATPSLQFPALHNFSPSRASWRQVSLSPFTSDDTSTLTTSFAADAILSRQIIISGRKKSFITFHICFLVGIQVQMLVVKTTNSRSSSNSLQSLFSRNTDWLQTDWLKFRFQKDVFSVFSLPSSFVRLFGSFQKNRRFYGSYAKKRRLERKLRKSKKWEKEEDFLASFRNPFFLFWMEERKK